MVRLELQADYLAGVWAHHIQKEKMSLSEAISKKHLMPRVESGTMCCKCDTKGKRFQIHFSTGPHCTQVGFNSWG